MELNTKPQGLIFIDVGGFSMWPFLRPGRKVVVKRVPINDLKIGDIILYRLDNELICHRLLRKCTDNNKSLLYARGDNSRGFPQVVTEEMFLGKVTGALRSGKIINLSGRKQQFVNRLIVAITPLVIILKPSYAISREFMRECKMMIRKMLLRWQRP